MQTTVLHRAVNNRAPMPISNGQDVYLPVELFIRSTSDHDMDIELAEINDCPCCGQCGDRTPLTSCCSPMACFCSTQYHPFEAKLDRSYPMLALPAGISSEEWREQVHQPITQALATALQPVNAKATKQSCRTPNCCGPGFGWFIILLICPFAWLFGLTCCFLGANVRIGGWLNLEKKANRAIEAALTSECHRLTALFNNRSGAPNFTFIATPQTHNTSSNITAGMGKSYWLRVAFSNATITNVV